MVWLNTHIFALTMNTLYQLLKDFDGTKAKSIDELTQSFGVIAERVLYGATFQSMTALRYTLMK